MTKNEAINRLKKNMDKWYKVRDKLEDTNITREIDKDYEATEILLALTRLDFENMEWEELNKITKIIEPIKREKYKTSRQRRALRRTYRSNHTKTEEEKERMRKYQAKYAEKNREKIREYNRNYQRERRRKKREENEKIISLFS